MVKGASPIGGNVAFGQVTPYASEPAGSHTLALQSGSKTVASTSEDLANGRHYTVVAEAQGKKIQLRLYPDGRAADGKARLRMIHAAPELGSPDVRLGSQPVAEKVEFTKATPYLTVGPGTYTLEVTKPGSGSPIVKESGVSLSAGTSSTAFLLGSRGEPTRVVTASDQTSAPAGAPRTGLAPLAAGERPWTAILGIAMLAGLLGGALHLLARRRRTHAR